MLTSTSAIVLSYTKYGDSSLIVHCLTEKLGRQSFLVYGVGNRKKNKLSSFQPLFIINTQIYNKSARSIQKIKEYKITQPLYSIATDIRKSTIAIFLAEVISKTIKEEYSDEGLYNFIKTSILILEELSAGISLFHITFLLKLAKQIGILPDLDNNAKYLDIKDGISLFVKPPHDYFIENTDIKNWSKILNTGFDNLPSISLPSNQKERMLYQLINLYEVHVLNLNSLKSYAVLKEVFS